MSTPTFIVGTGRCGSTMLSNMLREHPKVLSLSEFFAWTVDAGTALAEAFAPGPIDGAQFWAIIAAVTPTTSFGYRHRVPCDEQLYPYGDPAARYSAQTGVPAILSERSIVARLVLGVAFDWADMWWYPVGVIPLVVIDRLWFERRRRPDPAADRPLRSVEAAPR